MANASSSSFRNITAASSQIYPDDYLAEILPVAKQVAKATGAENYNVLQNNGRLAHQEVDHVSLSSLMVLVGA